MNNIQANVDLSVLTVFEPIKKKKKFRLATNTCRKEMIFPWNKDVQQALALKTVEITHKEGQHCCLNDCPHWLS